MPQGVGTRLAYEINENCVGMQKIKKQGQA